ncbi:MAG: SIS domain-containing protein, partial [Burkholderiales bacterium]|nr:SIS domain-containing protein [Burkholderiales bacterium]
MPDKNLLQQIRATPTLLRSQATRWQNEAQDMRRLMTTRPRIVLVGRGSSGNVCSFAAYVFALKTGMQPVEFRPWLITQSLPEPDYSDSVVLAFSRSGLSTDVAASAEWLRARGALVIAVSESTPADAHLMRVADRVLRLDTTLEQAFAPIATTSVIAALFVAAALAGFEIEDAANQTALCMENADATGVANKLAHFLTDARTVTWLARGPSVAGALEAALKWQQCAGVPAFGYSMAEYLHGPVTAARPQDRVVFFSGADEAMDSKRALTAALLARQVPFICLG